jgi:hypothetical protein
LEVALLSIRLKDLEDAFCCFKGNGLKRLQQMKLSTNFMSTIKYPNNNQVVSAL